MPSWFAEYQILFEDWFDINKVGRIIDEAIDKAEYAIIISNDAYLESPYCIQEINQILNKIDPKQILHIKHPHSDKVIEKYPVLTSLRTYKFDGDKVGLLLEIGNFLKRRLDVSVNRMISGCRCENEIISNYEYKDLRFKYSFDSTYYKVVDDGDIWGCLLPPLQPENMRGPMIRFEGEDFNIVCTFIAGTHAFPGRIDNNMVIDPEFIYRLKRELPSTLIQECADKLENKALNDDRVLYQMKTPRRKQRGIWF